VIALANGMEAVLVSDLQENNGCDGGAGVRTQAAVSMNVSAGNLQVGGRGPTISALLRNGYTNRFMQPDLARCAFTDFCSFSSILSICCAAVQDPPQWRGLAHLLEHMILQGSTKYPGASDFKDFIASAAGKSNAHTGLDNTNYHFSCSAARLEEGLDRFASLFVAPLLKVIAHFHFTLCNRIIQIC